MLHSLFRTPTAAILLAIAFCGHAQEPLLEKVVVQLKWQHQFQFAGYYMAKEKGFYEELGIDVEIRQRAYTTSTVDIVLSGAADYGVADASLLIDRAQGKPVVLLSQIFQQSPLVLLTLVDSGITGPVDLTGRSVMLDPQDNAPISAVLQAEIDDLSTVEMVDHSFNIDDLIDRKVDAWTAYITNEPFLLKERGISFFTIQPRDYGVDHYGDNLFTSEAEIQNHPDRARRMISATVRGWKYAFHNMDETRSIILENYATDKDPRHLEFESKMTEMVVMPDIVPVGQISTGRYQKIARDFYDLGLIDSPTVPSGFIYDGRPTDESNFALTREERAWLEEHGPVTIVTTDSDAPFQFLNENGETLGIIRDLGAALQHRLGVEVQVQGSTDQAFMDAARDPAVDIVGLFPENNFIRTWPRQQTNTTGIDIYFSVYGPESSSELVGPALIQGARVALPTQVAGDIKDRIRENNEVVSGGGNLAALQSVQNGEVDYAVCMTAIGEILLRDNPDLELRDLGRWPSPITAVLLVSDAEPLLLSSVNKALANIQTYELDSIMAKWTGSDSDIPTKIPISHEERAWIVDHPTIRFGLPTGMPPYAYTDGTGTPRGLFEDYFAIIKETTGIEFETVRKSWPELMEAARNREIDVLPAIHTQERDEFMDFTRDFFEIPYVIFTRNDVQFVRGQNWLEGKRIAVVGETAIHDMLGTIIDNVELIPFASVGDALGQVSEGELDAYVGDSISGSYVVVQNRLPNVKIAAPLDYPNDKLRLAVRSDWQPLTTVLSRTIATIEPEKHEEILRKWLSVRYEQPDLWTQYRRYVLGGGAALAALLLTVIIWNRQLGRKVAARTEELHRSQEQFTEIIEGTESLVSRVDSSGQITYVNDAARIVFGQEPSECIGRQAFDYVDPRDLERSRRWFGDCVRDEVSHSTLENRQVSATGEIRVILWSSHFHYDDDGNVSYVNSIGRDITARKNAEEERERLMSAIEQAAEAVVIVDAKATIQYVNPAFEEIIGYNREEAIDTDLRTLTGNTGVPTDLSAIWAKLEKYKRWVGRLDIEHYGGSMVAVEANFSPVYDSDGEVQFSVGVLRDVTRETALEEQLRQSQKMEAVGTLAGGIAHDFNNILAAVIGYAEILKSDLVTKDDRAAENADEILRAGERARDLVRQILAFSRKAEREHMPVSLGSLTKEVLKLLRGALPSTVELRQELLTDQDYVLADPTQIHQTIMNLCTNAWQSMRDTGGCITVRLESTAFDIDSRPSEHLTPGDYLALSVTDDGCGIESKVIDRIFDPFFTTKAKGEGTGMGLAVVHGVATSHGGTVIVDSEVGKGTTFTLYLPHYTGSPENERTEREDVTSSLTARILFVDDEAPLRKLAAATLSSVGHTVTTAEDGEEACERFSRDPDQFDIIISDLTMPRMTGTELATCIQQIRPNIPIILCTGFSDTFTPERLAEFGVRELLIKPIRSTDLADAVRRALETELAK